MKYLYIIKNRNNQNNKSNNIITAALAAAAFIDSFHWYLLMFSLVLSHAFSFTIISIPTEYTQR